MIKNFLRFDGIDWMDNSAISCSFWLISNETDGLFKLSLKPCCHTKKVMTIEIKAKESFDLEIFLKTSCWRMILLLKNYRQNQISGLKDDIKIYHLYINQICQN